MLKTYLTLINCYVSELGLYCKEGQVVEFPDSFKLPKTKEGYLPKFKYLSKTEDKPSKKEDDVDAKIMKRVDEIAKETGFSDHVLEGFFKEKKAKSAVDKLQAVMELASYSNKPEPKSNPEHALGPEAPDPVAPGVLPGI